MLTAIKTRLKKLLGRGGAAIPVVRLQGVIGSTGPLRSGLTLASVAKPLERAFSMKKAPAVALIINSPGGSPVQSRLIYTRIRALAEEHGKQVLVFVEDVAASGGYMIAIAGDEIIVDPSSVVGSIGVVSAGFGFTELISKIGVERRVYTAGTRKVSLDAFSPENPEDVAHLKSLQAEIHDVFISMVKDRRGELLSQDPDLFSGLFWTGRTACSLGLADREGDLVSVLKERFGEKAQPVLISQPRGLFGRRSSGGVGGSLGTTLSAGALTEDVLGALESRSLWARYGL
ncbi:peptidase S49 [Pannonibacter phragmitetus]|uniref:S49 family peptidase n=1 Tax=Pannonibacter TaxID=227873 RepID=UPI00067B51F9|nr:MULTISPECIES: S49 family peptidase [Pannonibacter]KND19952.1 peptidase S49 [Pannonibacter phragmitetus]